jgi:hypothetical protein
MTDSGNDTLAPTAMTDADLAELRETLGLCGGMTLVLQERIDRKTHVPCKDGWSWPIQEVEKRLDTMFRALPGALAELARLRGEVARLREICDTMDHAIFEALNCNLRTACADCSRLLSHARDVARTSEETEETAPAPAERGTEDAR